jgi:hypothetical protein
MKFDDYQELMEQFLDGRLAPVAFQMAYLAKFKHEARILPDEVFGVLDRLFAEVDAFCADEALLAKLNREEPGYYLDEPALRQRVSEARESLAELAGRRQARVM